MVVFSGRFVYNIYDFVIGEKGKVHSPLSFSSCKTFGGTDLKYLRCIKKQTKVRPDKKIQTEVNHSHGYASAQVDFVMIFSAGKASRVSKSFVYSEGGWQGQRKNHTKAICVFLTGGTRQVCLFVL